MPQPPKLPPDHDPNGGSSPSENYQKIADTVGGVPSFRKKDNLVQGLVVLVMAGIGVVVGWLRMPIVADLI